MSLDVYLYSEVSQLPEPGQEWESENYYQLYWANITHNLGKMAQSAGCYVACWRPEEISLDCRASDIRPSLTKAIADMEARPEHYTQFNSPNGWGTYENFLPWLKRYEFACRMNPTAKVRVSR